MFQTDIPAGGLMLQPLAVFGLLTPSGQITEAHSLKPFDARSEAAVKSVAGLRLSVGSSEEALCLRPWTRTEEVF
jgi:hypothetical protein